MAEKVGLTKKEKALMWVIYKNSNKDGVCLMKPVELLKLIPYKVEFRAEELDGVLKALELDDYIDNVVADHRGEKVYCITLHNNGHNFARTEANARRAIRNRIIMAVAMAALTAIVKTLITRLTGK